MSKTKKSYYNERVRHMDKCKTPAFLDSTKSHFRLKIYLSEADRVKGPAWTLDIGELRDARLLPVHELQGSSGIKYVNYEGESYIIDFSIAADLKVGKYYYFMLRKTGSEKTNDLRREAFSFTKMPEYYNSLGKILYKVFKNEMVYNFKEDILKLAQENPKFAKEIFGKVDELTKGEIDLLNKGI